jgi:glycosyltransferase involved in cell wall biosynthesis
MVGRLVPYKRFDLAIKSFSAMGLQLKIVGDGPERERLEDMAGDNVEFLGLLSDYKLPELYSHAQAVIFPQEEDFGIVPLEAMASGRPVIAYRAGGARETVIENVTGIFFNDATEIAIAKAVGQYQLTDFNPETIRSHAINFSKERFKKEFGEIITQKTLL